MYVNAGMHAYVTWQTGVFGVFVWLETNPSDAKYREVLSYETIACRDRIIPVPWYWLCRMGKFLFYLRKDFYYLYHVSGKEWRKMEIYAFVGKKFTRKGLNQFIVSSHNLHMTINELLHASTHQIPDCTYFLSVINDERTSPC